MYISMKRGLFSLGSLDPNSDNLVAFYNNDIEFGFPNLFSMI